MHSWGFLSSPRSLQFLAMASAQSTKRSAHATDFIKAFASLSAKDQLIPVCNPFPINFNDLDGHIQGIQLYKSGGSDFLYMTRSNSDAAYLIKARLESDTATMVAVDTLMLAPYGHPGGFQITEHYLAVGMEDFKARNTSRVKIYDLRKGAKSWSEPLHVIKRDGKYERVTAGAVGLTRIGRHMLLVVGNWDSRDLDFYICQVDKFERGEEGFQLIQEMNMAQQSREGWSDPQWRGYQNINLFNDGGDNLYLVGMERGGTDLYRLTVSKGKVSAINPKSRNPFQITKLASTQFKVSGNASFNAGAGLYRYPGGELVLFVAPDDIEGEAMISVFKTH